MNKSLNAVRSYIAGLIDFATSMGVSVVGETARKPRIAVELDWSHSVIRTVY